jgi:hypothetical protein
LYFFIGGGAFFTSGGEQLAALALRYAVPTVYEGRDFVMAGGLLSYGGSLTDSTVSLVATPAVSSTARSLLTYRSSSSRKSRCS